MGNPEGSGRRAVGGYRMVIFFFFFLRGGNKDVGSPEWGNSSGKGDKNPGGQASKLTIQRRQWQGRAACYLRNKVSSLTG